MKMPNMNESIVPVRNHVPLLSTNITWWLMQGRECERLCLVTRWANL